MVSLEVWTTSFSQCIRKESIFNFSFSKTSRFLKIFGNFWSILGNDARICKNKNWDWTWDWSVEPICPRLFLNIKDYFSTDNKWHWSDIFDFFSNRTCQEHSIKREASSISKQLENNQAIWKSNSSYFKALTGSISNLASFLCLGGYWWTLMRILGKNKILFSWFGPAHFNIFLTIFDNF